LTGLENIPEQKALILLETYQGANNYILKIKEKFIRNPKFYPTRAQAEYIIVNYDVIPKVAKKWVELDSYFAKKFADDKLYTEIPNKIYIEKLLVERDTSYHVWGKFFDKEELTDIWLPKASIIKTNNVEVNIDYEKYSVRPPLAHQPLAIESLLKNDRFSRLILFLRSMASSLLSVGYFFNRLVCTSPDSFSASMGLPYCFKQMFGCNAV
jgi:hypothetical protein